MDKQLLLESLSYRTIKRGPTRPLPLEQIISRRMEDLIAKRLYEIATGRK